MNEQMSKQYEYRTQTLGPGSDDGKQAKTLNPTIIWSKVGGKDVTSYEAGPRHVEIRVSELGCQAAQSFTALVAGI